MSKTLIEENTEGLQEILNKANNLPDAGGGESVSDVLRVTFDLDMLSMQITNVSHTVTEIGQAHINGKIVQAVFKIIDPSAGLIQEVMGNLSAYAELQGGPICLFSLTTMFYSQLMYVTISMIANGQSDDVVSINTVPIATL